MRVSALTDVFKVWVWALGSLVLALWATPVCFNGGKALSELSVRKDFSGVVNKMAAWCGAAEMDDFFKICWPLAALFLLWPLLEWLKLGNERGGRRVWSMRLPHGMAEKGQPIVENPLGLLHGVVGFCLTFGCFLLIGFALLRAGSFRWNGDFARWHEGLLFDIGWALAVAVVMEVFFRCVLMGIFLRAMGVWAAIGLAAAMFGGVHYLMSGFAVARGLDGETLSAVELTGTLLVGGDLLMRIVTVFVPWFAFGCVLGWARWRTASVWLPASLMMGWLLADRLFAKATDMVEIPDRLAAFVSAGSIHEGIVPFLGVMVVGGVVHLFTYRSKRGSDELRG